MDHTFTLRWTMPSSVPFAARPFPNSNGVIFLRIHSVPVIHRALGSESCGQWENKKEALTPYDSKAEASKSRGNRLPRLFQEKLDERAARDSEAEASKSCGNRLPQSFQDELDKRAARGDFGHHHLLGIDVPDKFKFKKEDRGKEQEAIPIEDVIVIEDDSEEADVFFGLPSGGISYDGKSTKPEDIDEWLRTRFGDKI